MAVVPNEINEKINALLKLLRESGLLINKAFLFGSSVRKRRDRWSDIDLAIVSEDFTGVPFDDRKKINGFILKVDSSIESHPFMPEDFTEDNFFVREIVRSGIEII